MTIFIGKQFFLHSPKYNVKLIPNLYSLVRKFPLPATATPAIILAAPSIRVCVLTVQLVMMMLMVVLVIMMLISRLMSHGGCAHHRTAALHRVQRDHRGGCRRRQVLISGGTCTANLEYLRKFNHL